MIGAIVQFYETVSKVKETNFEDRRNLSLSSDITCTGFVSFLISKPITKFSHLERDLRQPKWSSLHHTKLTSVALVRTRTIPTDRPPPVGEVSANFCG